MNLNKSVVLGFLFLLASSTAVAAQKYTSIGGDVYAAGTSPSVTSDAPRDVFAAGFSPLVNATVVGDLHVAGFSVDLGGKVGQDVYAVGANVSVNAAIQEDLTVSGFTVALNHTASVGGNARIAAGTLSVASPIAGSLVAGAGEVKLNAGVNGDVTLSAQEISFGPNARILGKLTYSSPSEIQIPASVITPERVRYTPLAAGRWVDDMHETVNKSVRSVWPSYIAIASGLVVTLAFLLVVAALFLAFAPETVVRLRERVQRHLGKSILFGLLGLSILIGLVPVSVTTIIGIPFVPFIVLSIIVAWTLGYILGAYVLSMRVAQAFGYTPESAGFKLLVLAIGLVVFGLMNFIPFIGWLINYAIVMLGLGAMTAGLLSRYNWSESTDSA